MPRLVCGMRSEQGPDALRASCILKLILGLGCGDGARNEVGAAVRGCHASERARRTFTPTCMRRGRSCHAPCDLSALFTCVLLTRKPSLSKSPSLLLFQYSDPWWTKSTRHPLSAAMFAFLSGAVSLPACFRRGAMGREADFLALLSNPPPTPTNPRSLRAHLR